MEENARIFKKIILHQKHQKVNLYPTEQRNLAQNIFYKSASTYKFLRERLQFNLPSSTSIYNWTPIKKLLPGFNEDILSLIKNKVSALDDRGRQVSILFDGMERPELYYNKFHDKIIGFEYLGKNQRNDNIAREVTIFMFRGLFDDWKIPLSFFVSKNAIDGTRLKELILQRDSY